MIEGYLSHESVTAGGRLDIHVSTDAPFFKVDFHRVGAEHEFAGTTGWLPGSQSSVPEHPDGIAGHASPTVDWRWPAHPFTIPAQWRPGVYVGFLVTSEDTGDYDKNDLTGFEKLCFVLRSSVPGMNRILYKRSTFTRHAYNRSDAPGIERASSLYDNPVYTSRGHKVSMRRPGHIEDVAYWDAPFIAWLERSGYQVDFCTDLDLHADPGLLSSYRLLLSVGHDEYWTERMRDAVEAFVGGGGNVAFFSANTCWWRVHLTDGDTAFVTDTDHRAGDEYPHLPATDLWWAPDGAGRPENTLTGVSFRNGGMWQWPGGWPADRPCPGFTVQHPGHWVFEGTGLQAGSALGAGLPLIGYECDGAAFAYDEHGVARATGTDGTPDSFLILGIAVLEPVHDDFFDLRAGHWNCVSREAGRTGPRAATMGVHTRNGTVFTAATTDWPMIVARGGDAALDRVTRNVLDRLSI
ncbi:N,N-dimethylformamidase beta subunit family domain-containing protein [Amycolatopsis panacis]|uniref:N,N-dimethylformamidase beta subunit-like C-terminal domain-containing protein n=1 Tax=Amycolatopsis panacis TaxID=2340917 RepID=A0A419HJE0_9PSEU|nr:N,N-dimethylformamidase beta subunit family domain-containing protein [Amycolatopsis panacis]RJQ75895.1 hypothetical protein D5S19_31210 [Amycolatopsis panacis]